jgi:hypothetical protein
MGLLPKNAVILVLLSLTVAIAQDSAGDGRYAPVRRGDLLWIQPGLKPLRLDGYEFTEAQDRDTNHFYVKGPNDRVPKRFYSSRGIAVGLGHTQQVVLINDEYTTKLQKVAVAHLHDYIITDVSSGAMRLYESDVRPDPRLDVNPEGFALSPDDHVVLIRIVLTHVSVDSAELAGKVGGTFTPRWYAVDSSTGKVLRTFEGSDPPRTWY